jgi:hypothetical protein
MLGVKLDNHHNFYIYQLVICTFGGIKNKDETPENYGKALPSQGACRPYSGRHA